MHTTEALAAVYADDLLIDRDRRVAEALAQGTTVVDGLAQADVYRSLVDLICDGYVESIAHTPCISHPGPASYVPEVEETLCGIHTLRFGDVEVQWSYCYQEEVLSIEEAADIAGVTTSQFVQALIEDDFIAHPDGGYIPIHPSLRPRDGSL